MQRQSKLRLSKLTTPPTTKNEEVKSEIKSEKLEMEPVAQTSRVSNVQVEVSDVKTGGKGWGGGGDGGGGTTSRPTRRTAMAMSSNAVAVDHPETSSSYSTCSSASGSRNIFENAVPFQTIITTEQPPSEEENIIQK